MPEPLRASTDHREPHPSQSSRNALAEISSSVLDGPVPDYASTLINQVEQENLRFLRGELSSGEHLSDLRDDYEGGRHLASEYPARRPAQLGSSSLGGIEERAREVMDQEYSGWGPDWGPASDGEGDQPQISRHPSLYEPGYINDSDGPGDLLRHTMRLRRLRHHFQSQLNERNAQQNDSGESTPRHPSRFIENGMSPTPTELRTQAMIQAVRQSTEVSSRSRSELQRYLLARDRERRQQGNERNSSTGTDYMPPHLLPSQRRQMRQQQEEQSLRQQIAQNRTLHDEFQRHRNNLEEQLRQTEQSMTAYNSTDTRRRRAVPTPHTPTYHLSLDNTVRYLESLRLCESNDEGLEAADDRNLDPEELFPHNTNDFLLDTSIIPPPPMTSFLQPGAIFSGTQHAMPARLLNLDDQTLPPIRNRVRLPNFGRPGPHNTSPVQTSTLVGTSRARTSSQPPPSTNDQDNQAPETPKYDDHWPVKVSLHAIDLDEMTLSGTMEACNVPDKTSPSKTSNITTYLEGEIIDFNKFTLETKSFRADSRVDGTYWMKLPPFSEMKDEETATKCLLSKEWVREEMMMNWVLMRWKEKHFVTPTEAESSLTISGFYYVSLRRSDGKVEGLYYDPSSTPYQHLSLQPEKRTFPAYGFR